MLVRIFGSCKTLSCFSHPMFQEAGHRLLMHPLALCLLLDRLAFSDSRSSRFEGRIRLGSRVALKHWLTGEQLSVQIVTSEEAHPAKGKVSFTSLIGAELLGLRCGDIANLTMSDGEIKWQVVSVNHNVKQL